MTVYWILPLFWDDGELEFDRTKVRGLTPKLHHRDDPSLQTLPILCLYVTFLPFYQHSGSIDINCNLSQ